MLSVQLKGFYKSFQNLSEKTVALSDTIVSGKPNLANNLCKKSIVTLLVGVLHLQTSGYFVKLSTTMK